MYKQILSSQKSFSDSQSPSNNIFTVPDDKEGQVQVDCLSILPGDIHLLCFHR